MKSFVLLTSAAAFALTGPLCPAVAQQSPRGASVTFARDIAPILYEHCGQCHRPDGSAPFSLLSYEGARARARLIAEVTARRAMPPWLPARTQHRFVGERFLSKEQIALIERWVEAGAPEGDPEELPAAPMWKDGWQLGEPDLVVEFPTFKLPGSQEEVYRNLVRSPDLAGPRWVRAVEVRPGNLAVAHHARLMIDTTASSRRIDAQDPEPGFNGMELVSRAMSPPGFFIGWTPGKVSISEDQGFAWRLEAGTDLVLQLHLRPTEKTEVVSPRVGLYFADSAPSRQPAVVMLGTKIIDIPAGKADYLVVDSYELPVDVEVLGVYPHAHYLATRMEGFAQLPDGSTEDLILIEDWDFNWQDEYRYATPIPLPKGTTLVMRYTYDNSTRNPQNPHEPPKRVRYGPTSGDEMADLVVQLLPRNSEDLAVLRRDIEWKDYRDEVTWWAHQELTIGAELAAEGHFEEAVRHYREALGHRSDYPEAHEALGRALAELGDWERAVIHLEHSAQLDPSWPQPLVTLSRLLATHPDPAKRDPKEAIELAKRATSIADGRDPMALEALALAYDAAGRTKRARETREKAIELAEAQGHHGMAEEIRRRGMDRKPR